MKEYSPNSVEIGQIAVVIPVYKQSLNALESISLHQVLKVLGQYKIIFVGPEDLNTKEYEELCVGNFEYVSFKEKYFDNVGNYSYLLTTSQFYKPFLAYKYILIYQLDAYVFKDELLYWCNQNYDYIGAPWIAPEWQQKLKQRFGSTIIKYFFKEVGNGGLSLRKVATFYKAALFCYLFALLWPKHWNEDSFWSNLVPKIFSSFKIPQTKIALQFAFEEKPEKCFALNENKLPFGCHAWEKYNPEFWKQYIDF